MPGRRFVKCPLGRERREGLREKKRPGKEDLFPGRMLACRSSYLVVVFAGAGAGAGAVTTRFVLCEAVLPS
jgi:hypothetical protein